MVWLLRGRVGGGGDAAVLHELKTLMQNQNRVQASQIEALTLKLASLQALPTAKKKTLPPPFSVASVQEFSSVEHRPVWMVDITDVLLTYL